jgi:hypothetical protein
MSTPHLAQRQAELEEKLFVKYGPFVGGSALRLLLGYSTGAAFRQAVRHKRVPVTTFLQEGRQPRFASTKDVAAWIARTEARAEVAQGEPEG